MLQFKVLLTGFEPFQGEAQNSSAVAVSAFRGKRIAGHRIVTAVLPTEFGSSLQILCRLLVKHKPALVVCTGQANMRSVLSLERKAINIKHARIPDNRGLKPVDEKVISAGPARYFSTLPLKATLAELKKAGVKTEISNTAGTFVCNYVFFGLMHELSTRKALKRTRGGFIHLPLLPEQTLDSVVPVMTLEQMVMGLRLAIQTALQAK